VRLMGGTITLESDKDQRTCMSLSLPMQSAGAAPDKPLAGIATIVTRHAAARPHYQTQLARLGYQVEPLEGEACEQQTALVLLDAQDIPTDRLQQLLHHYEQENTPILLLRAADDHRQLAWQGQVLEQSLPLLPGQLQKALALLLNSNPPQAQPTERPISEQWRGRGHLLIAEDNQVNQLVVKTLLEKAGYSLELTENGADALRLYREDPERYDLILMDCEMPQMDGFEATRRIRAHEQREHLPRTPIVALTAHVLDTHRLEGMTAGMDDYLPKPVDSEQLYASLQRLIRSRAIQ